MSGTNYGEQLAVHNHRLEQLEQWPPRVEAVERQVQAVKTQMNNVTASLEDVKAETHKTNANLDNLDRSIARLFWTGAGGFAVVAFMWTLAFTLYKAGVIQL